MTRVGAFANRGRNPGPKVPCGGVHPDLELVVGRIHIGDD